LLYDGPNAVQVQELSNGSVVSTRLTGGIDEFFSRADSTGTFSPLTNALGSTIALTDSNGNLQTQYTYEPFGNTTVTGPANANPYQFTSRENDGTGLYYYRARYYSPIYQRFISEDPIRLIFRDVNFYAYAHAFHRDGLSDRCPVQVLRTRISTPTDTGSYTISSDSPSIPLR
jgi:RHS repeat-associated protein